MKRSKLFVLSVLPTAFGSMLCGPTAAQSFRIPQPITAVREKRSSQKAGSAGSARIFSALLLLTLAPFLSVGSSSAQVRITIQPQSQTVAVGSQVNFSVPNVSGVNLK